MLKKEEKEEEKLYGGVQFNCEVAMSVYVLCVCVPQLPLE